MPDTDLTTRCRPCDSGTPTLPPEEVKIAAVLNRGLEPRGRSPGAELQIRELPRDHRLRERRGVSGAQGGAPSRPGSRVQVL